MEVELHRIVTDASEAAYSVIVDGVVVGRVERRQELGRNLVKSFVNSGSDRDGRTRRAKLWIGVVECVELDEDERRTVQRSVTRTKTTRQAAAKHLVDAFAQAGVSIPAKSP